MLRDKNFWWGAVLGLTALWVYGTFVKPIPNRNGKGMK